MDFKVFQHPFTCILAGPTQCGKTTFIKRLHAGCQKLIDPPPERFIYCYNDEYEDAYHVFNLGIPEIEFHRGLPNIAEMDSSTPKVIVLDDMVEKCEKDKSILQLFTVDSHHKNISIILITQNLFSKGKYMRTISLNSHYIVAFNNPRDKLQISHLARQMFPNNPNFLIECYEDAVENKPFGYLFIDLKQKTLQKFRIRTGIFEDDKEKIVYVPK